MVERCVKTTVTASNHRVCHRRRTPLSLVRMSLSWSRTGERSLEGWGCCCGCLNALCDCLGRSLHDCCLLGAMRCDTAYLQLLYATPCKHAIAHVNTASLFPLLHTHAPHLNMPPARVPSLITRAPTFTPNLIFSLKQCP